MKAKNQNRTCPDVMSNECIVWQGGDVPFLSIEDGDPLNISEKQIADKLVELYSNIDMSQVDMHCIADNCAQKCKDNSLFSVIQILFDNQCCLTDLVNSITGGTVTPTISVNMRCLNKFDDFGNIIPQDINQSIQSIINQVCQNTTDITALQGDFQSLQSQVDAINTTPVVPPEINVTTCLTSLRPISQTIPIVAQSICDYRTLLGDTVDVSQAMSQQCSNLNSTFAGVDGWNNSVSNLAQSFANLWILACNLNSRLTLIENNCCKVTCDDVKIGFDVQVDTSGTGVFLKFTAGAGTSIPASFIDSGSTVTFTDSNNSYVTYPLVISNNANQGDFDLSGLSTSNPITISVTAILSTPGLTCEKCITRLYSLANTSCPVCAVVASGTSGNVTITYTLPGSQNIQSLVLQNGQTGYIQKNAQVVSITNTGDVTADSSCINLTPLPMNCYVFYWEHSTVNDDTLAGWRFNTVFIGNLTYTVDAPYRDSIGAGNTAGAQLFASIGANVPAGVMTPSCILTDTNFLSKISVQVPSSLPAPIIRATGPTGVSSTDFVSLYMYSTTSTNASTDCGCNTSSGGGSHQDA